MTPALSPSTADKLHYIHSLSNLQLEPAGSSTALNKMTTKILSSTPVVVMWLEPTRDRGKESIVKAREIVKPHRSKLQPGQTALIKWRSSGRVYKAIVKSIQGKLTFLLCILIAYPWVGLVE